MIEQIVAWFVGYAPVIALVGFFSGFLLILGIVMHPSKKAEMDKHARIPLKENE